MLCRLLSAFQVPLTPLVFTTHDLGCARSSVAKSLFFIFSNGTIRFFARFTFQDYQRLLFVILPCVGFI